ncbi:MAG: DUF2891 domain-containing protein [Gammaproteobacteria bacterium]
MTVSMTNLDKKTAGLFARMALKNVEREYPNHIMHMLNDDADVQPPRALHPAFYGSYDWHSSVHSHWLLVRLLRLFPAATFATDVLEVLNKHLTEATIAVECRYFEASHRAGFERPYGLAWLLQLASELHEWQIPEATKWRAALAPLEMLTVRRLSEWLSKLSHPIRSGEHANTAFALGLAYDYARSTRHAALEALLKIRGHEFYSADISAPLAYEPSGHDFLSPLLAEADLMRRILPQNEFASWLTKFLPQISVGEDTGWLRPVSSRDPSDGKLAHLDGLNLSRAWMLAAIAAALPDADSRRTALFATAQIHADAGLTAVTDEHYEGSHWLPSFAVYLYTKRGLNEKH